MENGNLSLFDLASATTAGDKMANGNFVSLIPGDFLKNAGIVGFLRLWEFVCRKRGVMFEPVDQIPVDEIPNPRELAEDYVDAYVEAYGGDSKVQRAFDKLKYWSERIDQGLPLEGDAEILDDVNFGDKGIIAGRDEIAKALASASVKSGFEGIKDLDDVQDVEVFDEFLKHQLKFPKPKDDLKIASEEFKKHIQDLHRFCEQKRVRQTFLFKSVAYNVINKYWSDRSFLLRANSKKNMIDLVEADFTAPFVHFIEEGKKEVSKKGKISLNCISCSAPMSKKSDGAPISFMVDMADDLNRKTSTYWNHIPDAYLCPACALIYSLAPLGFSQIEKDNFVFINSNDSVKTLWRNNQKKLEAREARSVGATEETGDSDDNSGGSQYLRRVDAALLRLLDEKRKNLSNIQVVVRPKDTKEHYRFNVIDRDLLELIHKEKLEGDSRTVRVLLEELSRRKPFKIAGDQYVNVYRRCLDNVLNYRNQYNLLNMLAMKSLEEPWVGVFLLPVFHIQCLQTSRRRKNEESNRMDNISALKYYASQAGGKMRNRLFADAVGAENVKNLPNDRKEDLARGVVYQLTNSLKTRNTERFIDVLLRLYMSCKESIPPVFMNALQDEETFLLVGYAFVLGLKGAFYDKKEGA